MRHRARPEDTSIEAWRLQRDRWRAMTPAEKLAVCDQMSIDVVRMAEAGIKATEGDISDERLEWLLTRRRYGREIAELACGAEPQR